MVSVGAAIPAYPAEWTSEKLQQSKVEGREHTFISLSAAILGGFGVLYSDYQFIKIAFFCTKLTTGLLCLAIASLAVTLLGLYSYNQVQNYVGLKTPPDGLRLTLNTLRDGFQALPIFKKPLTQAYVDQFKAACQKLEATNQAAKYFSISRDQLLMPLFNPQDEAPRFQIDDSNLTEENVLEILDIAYAKKIIIEFTSFTQHPAVNNDSQIPGIKQQIDASDLSGCHDQIKYSFSLALKYITKRLKDKKDYDREFVNSQLLLFSLRFAVKDNAFISWTPPLSIEDGNHLKVCTFMLEDFPKIEAIRRYFTAVISPDIPQEPLSQSEPALKPSSSTGSAARSSSTPLSSPKNKLIYQWKDKNDWTGKYSKINSLIDFAAEVNVN